MSSPVPPQIDPADLWDWLVSRGVSESEATAHVNRYLQSVDPAETRKIKREATDPGALASFGLGAADMMSFGMGKQIGKGMLTSALLGSSADVEAAAQAQHPVAHDIGEVAGLVGPGALEVGLAKAGKLVPTALGAAINAIKNKPVRGVARAALHAATGGGLAAAQAGLRTEGDITARTHAAADALPWGAAAGVALPMMATGVPVMGRAITRPVRAATSMVSEILDRYAGRAPIQAIPSVRGLVPIGADIGELAASKVAPSMPAGMTQIAPKEAARAATAPTIPDAFQEATQAAQGRVGGVGGHSYSGTYPKAVPMTGTLSGAKTMDLLEAARAPGTNPQLLEAIFKELQRRRIAGNLPGQLPVP